jgi:hypothetical protein
LNWTNPRACLTQSGPHGAAALFDVSVDQVQLVDVEEEEEDLTGAGGSFV